MRWHNEGERSTQYYIAMEKSSAKYKLMSKVRLEDNTISRNQKKILKEQAKFYRNLYKSNSTIKFSIVNNDNVRSLYVVRNNVELLCNSNLLLYYVNLIMYK